MKNTHILAHESESMYRLSISDLKNVLKYIRLYVVTPFFVLFCFIIHMCIQGLGHFSPLPPPPPGSYTFNAIPAPTGFFLSLPFYNCVSLLSQYERTLVFKTLVYLLPQFYSMHQIVSEFLHQYIFVKFMNP
jgi:hypothetical protein